MEDWEERFWSKVQRSSNPGECWPWLGGKTEKGYGRFKRRHGRYCVKDERAHRVMWELHNGRSLEPGEQVLHSCDNPPCCNPAHLSLGTNRDNQRECADRGRAPRTGFVRKVWPDDIPRIQALYLSGVRVPELARRYEVTETTMWTFVRGLRAAGRDRSTPESTC